MAILMAAAAVVAVVWLKSGVQREIVAEPVVDAPAA